MMDDLIFRPVTSEDFVEQQGLLRELGYDLPVATIAENVREIRARGGEVFVVVGNGRLLACTAAIIDVRLGGGICGEIVSLVVTESARGQGIGRRLVQHAEQWLGQFVQTMRVRTNAIRTDAHRFYEAGGYQLEKSHKIYKKRL